MRHKTISQSPCTTLNTGGSTIVTLISRFMEPTWGTSGADRTQMGPCWPHEPCYLGWIVLGTGSGLWKAMKIPTGYISQLYIVACTGYTEPICIATVYLNWLFIKRWHQSATSHPSYATESLSTNGEEICRSLIIHSPTTGRQYLILSVVKHDQNHTHASDNELYIDSAYWPIKWDTRLLHSLRAQP